MGWTITADVADYLAQAGRFLRSDPVERTVELVVTDRMLRAAPPPGRRPDSAGNAAGHDAFFCWWRPDGQDGRDGPGGRDRQAGQAGQGGEVSATAMHTGGSHPLLLTDMPAAAAERLATLLAGRETVVPEVNATPEGARAFGAAWERLTGAAARLRRRECLYRLERLTPPDPAPPGAGRIAGHSDRDLVLTWFKAFQEEAHGHGISNPALVDDRLEYGGVVLWEVDGVPVSVAGRTRVVAGMSRIAPVYTPPEHRRHGYGAAATAAAARAARKAGAREVVLFTDLANPTSNSVYRRLGFRPVCERLALTFEPAER